MESETHNIVFRTTTKKYCRIRFEKDIIYAVVEELHACGYNLGYRALWNKLKTKYKLKVKRDTVYEILKIADPQGIEERYGNKLRRRQYLSPGPNFVWHMDGYDKLKQFGFAIHGCVDGFSRMVLWLEVATTNNDPKVTAYYYLNTAKSLKFLPTILRCDKGSENGLIGLLQVCLRKHHPDKFAGENSFVQGKSTRNQRIESYWGRMRQHTVDYYIQLFKCMQERNLFNGSNLHIKCLQFCFGPLIKYDLNSNKELWNQHHIKKQPAQNNMAGKPLILFNLPEKFNCRNYKKPVDLEALGRLIERYTTKPHLIDPKFQELVNMLLPDYSVPSDPNEAVQLHKKLLRLIDEHNQLM